MPEDVHKHAVKELKRLQRMGEGSAEGSMLRTYLEWLAELPWKEGSVPEIDIAKARQILDEDHYGLDKIKRRILEHLAVRKLNPQRQEPDPVLRRPSRRGQDLARPVDRARHRAQVPAHRAGRGARRSRDPRPPAHLHRRAAGQRDPGDPPRRVAHLRADVRRDRQARPGRLPRRSVERAARGARPGAELEIPRQLPRGGLRPVEGHVHHHREHARHHPGPAARPHGDHPAPRLHRGREARDRQALPGEAPARGKRTRLFESGN